MPDVIWEQLFYIVILYYDPTMAVIALLSAPVSVIMSKFLLSKMRKYSLELRKASSDVITYQEDSFQNIQTIKSFGIVDIFEKGMRKVQTRYKELTMERGNHIWNSHPFYPACK